MSGIVFMKQLRYKKVAGMWGKTWQKKKTVQEELEDILHELELRIEDEEERTAVILEEKKAMQQQIKDLEEQ